MQYDLSEGTDPEELQVARLKARGGRELAKARVL